MVIVMSVFVVLNLFTISVYYIVCYLYGNLLTSALVGTLYHLELAWALTAAFDVDACLNRDGGVDPTLGIPPHGPVCVPIMHDIKSNNVLLIYTITYFHDHMYIYAMRAICYCFGVTQHVDIYNHIFWMII